MSKAEYRGSAAQIIADSAMIWAALLRSG